MSIVTMVTGRRGAHLPLGVLILLAAGLSLAPVPHPLRLLGAALLAFGLPGWAMIGAFGLDVRDVLERLVLAVGLSFATTVLLSLVLLYVQGRLTAISLLACLALGSLALAVAGWLRTGTSSVQAPRLKAHDLIYAGVCTSVAAGFALVSLGYADYWGDEMNGLLRAIAVVGGQVTTIFEHTKGPAEILVPAAYGSLVGRFDPFTLRLPFALAHAAGVAAFYVLVRRMFSSNAALLAALLLAINGLYLAFGRMVQYQTLVFLATALAVLMAYRFYREGKAGYLAVSALLAGVGLLAHYDAVLTFPALGYLVWRRYSGRAAAWKTEWRRPALAGLLLLVVTCLFYVPYLLNPRIGQTSSYLASIVVGSSSWPVNNLQALYQFAVLHNSAYYVAFIVLFGVVKMGWDTWRTLGGSDHSQATTTSQPCGSSELVTPHDRGGRWSAESRRRRYFLAFGVLFCVIVWLLGRPDLVPLIAFGSLLFVLIAYLPLDTETRTMYLWFAIAFFACALFVDRPRAHTRVMYAPWLVLVALALTDLVGWRQAGCRSAAVVPCLRKGEEGASATVHSPTDSGQLSRSESDHLGTGPRLLYAGWPTVGKVLVLGLLYLLFARYQYLLMADARAEYIFTYPEHKISWYWEDPDFPFGSRRMHGTPHRLGWQMVNQLFLDGTLSGDWDSNDSGSNLFWYTLGWPQNSCYPRYYFASQFQQRDDEADVTPPTFPLDRYARIGQIWNRDRLQMDIYEFAPLGDARQPAIWSEPEHYATFVTPTDFRSLPYSQPAPVISSPLVAPAVFRPSRAALEAIAAHYGDARITGVPDTVALTGYDLDDRWAKPGGVLVVTLYWQALDTVNLPYKVFVHLEDSTDGRTRAQSDELPACGTRSTQSWHVGETVADRHVIVLPADIPAGEYLIRMGLYEPETQQRMDRLDSMGNAQGTDLELLTVNIPAGE